MESENFRLIMLIVVAVIFLAFIVLVYGKIILTETKFQKEDKMDLKTPVQKPDRQ